MNTFWKDMNPATFVEFAKHKIHTWLIHTITSNHWNNSAISKQPCIKIVFEANLGCTKSPAHNIISCDKMLPFQHT